MDLITGETLAEVIKRLTTIPCDEFLPILEQICAALYHAHSHSVVHRDVKPANIMVTYNPELSIKILDFGIAKIVNEEAGQVQALTRTGEIFGSPLYMSPEQCSGGIIDTRSDIYSLGCVAYEALTGAPPHIGANALRTMMLHQSADVIPLSEAGLGLKFSPEWERVVAKMLAREPRSRYSDVRAVIADLKPDDKNRLFFTPAKNIAQKSKEKFTVSMNPLQLGSLMTVVFLASALVTFAAVKTLDVKKGDKDAISSARADKRETPNAENSQEANAIDYDHLPKFTSHVQMVDGQLMRVTQFPQVNLGVVQSLTDNYARQLGHRQMACGSVTVPAERMVSLTIERTGTATAIAHPQVIKAIDPTLFSLLAISGADPAASIEAAAVASVEFSSFDVSKTETPSKTANELASEQKQKSAAKISEQDLDRGQEEVLKNVQGWTNLRGITFESGIVSDEVVGLLAKLPHLECIRLLNCRQVSSKFADLPILKMMRVLSMIGYNPQFLWKDGSQFKRLEELKIDCALTPHVVAELRRMPKLQTLKLYQSFKTGIPDEAVRWMASSSLRDITVEHAQLTPSQVEQILSKKALIMLRVSRECKPVYEAAGVSSRKLNYKEPSFME